jgi:hypothetical protein
MFVFASRSLVACELGIVMWGIARRYHHRRIERNEKNNRQSIIPPNGQMGKITIKMTAINSGRNNRPFGGDFPQARSIGFFPLDAIPIIDVAIS